MTREKLHEEYGEDIVLIEGKAFDNAIIGVTTDLRAVYDYTLMAMGLMTQEKISAEEAVEWIDYNIVRSLPYMENSPVIVHLDI